MMCNAVVGYESRTTEKKSLKRTHATLHGDAQLFIHYSA